MNISRTTSTGRLLAAALASTFLTASAFGATVLTINTTNDTGAGSLRDTIVRLNDVCAAGDAQCKVTIDLPQYSSFAPHTPLPPITACGSIEIDGGRETIEDDRLFELSGRNLTFGSGLNVRPDCSDGFRKLTISGLAINSFPQDGISIHPTGGQYEVVLSGLFIGTDMTGREARANAWRGVAVTSPLATVRVETSIVSGNGRSGVWGWDSAYVSVRASKLGVGADGRPLGNDATGFALLRGRGDIRESIVAHNAHWGMSAVPGAYLNSSYRNSIHSNGVLGVDWGIDLQTLNELSTAPAAPVVTSATYDATTNKTTIRGTVRIDSIVAGSHYTVHVYSNSSLNARGFVEGERWEWSSTPLFPQGQTGTFNWEVVVFDRDLRGRILSAMTALGQWDFPSHTSSELSHPFSA